MESFGEKLSTLRKTKGWTQTKLGLAIGRSKQMISVWEKDIASPSIKDLIVIAQTFNCSLDEMLGLNPTEEIDVLEKNKREKSRYLRIIEELSEQILFLSKELNKLQAQPDMFEEPALGEHREVEHVY